MLKYITYFEGGHRFECFKIKVGNYQRCLVKKDGKPEKTFRFNIVTGNMLLPSYL